MYEFPQNECICYVPCTYTNTNEKKKYLPLHFLPLSPLYILWIDLLRYNLYVINIPNLKSTAPLLSLFLAQVYSNYTMIVTRYCWTSEGRRVSHKSSLGLTVSLTFAVSWRYEDNDFSFFLGSWGLNQDQRGVATDKAHSSSQQMLVRARKLHAGQSCPCSEPRESCGGAGDKRCGYSFAFLSPIQENHQIDGKGKRLTFTFQEGDFSFSLLKTLNNMGHVILPK